MIIPIKKNQRQQYTQDRYYSKKKIKSKQINKLSKYNQRINPFNRKNITEYMVPVSHTFSSKT
jgi:hypothetical protein